MGYRDAPQPTGVRRSGSCDSGGVRLALLVLVIILLFVLAVGWVARSALPPGVARWINPVAYTGEIAAAAARQGLDPHLVMAVVKAESSFQRSAVSKVGAVGLMQLMPDTARWITGRPDWERPAECDLTDPVDNLALGCYYLRFLLDLYDGDTVTALAAYNAGQGVVHGWLSAAGGSADGRLELAAIPYSDTRDFVRRVLEYRDLYARIYPDVSVDT